ncbi:phosphatidylinositol synthase [Rhynchophorus ferrugineus]|uniref:CDP-diacylglycerol--inositol 3-phosphatidyltransferase n=1 Tax=Rhynchophorus ferrugineus TaxID=354439 RepID=A0A834IX25_RHYFE|nr:hypothetical protein GWI33_004683 [Rhynchophorus ferrugineus]
MTSNAEDFENIFVFVPNLIGYCRIIMAIISFYFMPTNYTIAIVCYVISALLDAFDGYAARYFNQSTKFGAMLDQLTDRCGTMGLTIVLAHLYPKYMFLFLLSISIDISSHWLYLHSTVVQGKKSHKFIDMSENPIMNIYYTNKIVLFVMCAGNESFFIALYLLYFAPTVIGFKIVLYVTAPIMLAKTFISLLHCTVAAKNLAIVDVNERKEMFKKAE